MRNQTTEQLVQTITRTTEPPRGATRIAVPVELPHASMGALPSIAITHASTGTDWDKGTLFLHTEKPLTPLSTSDVAEMHKCRADEQSWAMHKAYERWEKERYELLAVIHRMRQSLMLTGMSTAELDLLTGELPAERPNRRKFTK